MLLKIFLVVVICQFIVYLLISLDKIDIYNDKVAIAVTCFFSIPTILIKRIYISLYLLWFNHNYLCYTFHDEEKDTHNKIFIKNSDNNILLNLNDNDTYYVEPSFTDKAKFKHYVAITSFKHMCVVDDLFHPPVHYAKDYFKKYMD